MPGPGTSILKFGSLMNFVLCVAYFGMCQQMKIPYKLILYGSRMDYPKSTSTSDTVVPYGCLRLI